VLGTVEVAGKLVSSGGLASGRGEEDSDVLLLARDDGNFHAGELVQVNGR
jgi:hypothetical protein